MHNTPNAMPVIDKKKASIYALSADGVLHGLTLDNGEDKIALIDFVCRFCIHETLEHESDRRHPVCRPLAAVWQHQGADRRVSLRSQSI